MPTARRTFAETITVLVFLAALVGTWAWLSKARETDLAEARERHAVEVARIEDEAAATAAELRRAQAVAAFEAFAAGIHPAVLAGRREALLQSKAAILKIERVEFVHLLGPDGRVLMSSDEKLTTAGSADERAEWALGAEELRTRPGSRDGSIELAAPVFGPSGPAAHLWMGYDLGR